MDMQSFDLVRQMSAGHYLTRSLHVVAELGVADAIGDGPTPVGAIAQATGANADALERILRLLASRGVFMLEDGSVRHTDASRFLISSHPASLRSFTRMMAQPLQWGLAGELLHAVRTGQSAAERVHPDGFWGYLQSNPETERIFGAAMAAKASAQISGILATHDFSRYGEIVDIGGGQGHMLRAILDKHPGVSGVLFDLPAVIEGAKAAGSGERLTFVPGDFLSDGLPSGDAMILMEVLHDWDDAHCARILQAVRKAARPDTTLLVIEIEMTEGDGPDWPKLLDIVMLAAFAARQRTNGEYGALLEANGFAVTGETRTGAGVVIIEALPI
jgi:hypothetical protein